MTTPEPSEGVMYEAPAPPAPAPAATARFVPIAAGDAPAFPLGTKTTPMTGYSKVLANILLAALSKFEKKMEVELETLEALPSSESSDATALTPLFPWNDGILHVPSSDRRQVNHAKSKYFLQPKAKTFDELINEATKA